MFIRKGTGEKLAKHLKAAFEELKQLPPEEQELILRRIAFKSIAEPAMNELLPFNREKIELHK